MLSEGTVLTDPGAGFLVQGLGAVTVAGYIRGPGPLVPIP